MTTDIYQNAIDNALAPMVLRVGVAGSRDLYREMYKGEKSETVEKALSKPQADDLSASLIRQLATIYEQINTFLLEIAATEVGSTFYRKDPPTVRLTSSLAEGVDRLAFGYHRPLGETKYTPVPKLDFKQRWGWEAAVILPFAKQTFEEDFRGEQSIHSDGLGSVDDFNRILEQCLYPPNNHTSNADIRMIELDGDPEQRAKAYIDCSRVHMEHCDLLIAIYDKEKDTGLEGTSATVRFAQELRRPIISIDINHPEDVQLTYYTKKEKFEERLLPTGERWELLGEQLARLLLFTDEMTVSAPQQTWQYSSSSGNINNSENEQNAEKNTSINSIEFRKVADRLRDYQKNHHLKPSLSDIEPDFSSLGPIELIKARPNWLYGAFDYFKKQMQKTAEKHHPVNSTTQSKPADDEGTTALRQELPINQYYSAFLRADRLANYCAAAHRSSYLLIYLAGFLALLFATLAISLSNYTSVVAICITVEIFLVTSIFALYVIDSEPVDLDKEVPRLLVWVTGAQKFSRAYHRRWLEYRYLAEVLRSLAHLSTIGRSYSENTYQTSSDYFHRYRLAHSNRGSSWVNMYTETLIRHIGFRYTPLNQQRMRHARRLFISSWIDNQIHYHQKSSFNNEHVFHLLERWGTTCFFSTVLVLMCKLALLPLKAIWYPDPLTPYPQATYSIYSILSSMSDVLSFAAIMFPVLAATMIAISSHSEFSVSAGRSKSMANFLIKKRKALLPAHETMRSDVLNQHIDRISQETMREISGWLEIYESKKSGLV